MDNVQNCDSYINIPSSQISQMSFTRNSVREAGVSAETRTQHLPNTRHEFLLRNLLRWTTLKEGQPRQGCYKVTTLYFRHCSNIHTMAGNSGIMVHKKDGLWDIALSLRAGTPNYNKLISHFHYHVSKVILLNCININALLISHHNVEAPTFFR
jgi:hypothetical protein